MLRRRIASLPELNEVDRLNCGCSLMVRPQLPKLMMWVRFPSPAPLTVLLLSAGSRPAMHPDPRVRRTA